MNWRLNLCLNRAPTPNFTIADAFFSSTKNVNWQVSLSLSQSGYCPVASSHVDSGSFSQVWSCACVNGYFQTENSGILKRVEGTMNCNFALCSNWIKKVDTLGFTHQWKDSGSHVLHSECSFLKGMYFRYLNNISKYSYCVLWFLYLNLEKDDFENQVSYIPILIVQFPLE